MVATGENGYGSKSVREKDFGRGGGAGRRGLGEGGASGLLGESCGCGLRVLLRE